MTKTETLALIARAKAGDVQARNELWGSNLGLAGKIARRYSGPGRLDFDDAYSEACSGLLLAIERLDRFDPAKGVWSTFAGVYIRRAILDLERIEDKRAKRFPKAAEWEEERSRALSPGDEPADPECPIDTPEWAAVARILDRWKKSPETEDYAEAIALRFGIDPRGPLGFTAIGRLLALDPSSVSTRVQTAVRWLKREVNGEPIHPRPKRRTAPRRRGAPVAGAA